MAVSINGTTRLIEVTDALDLTFNVARDVYSEWKRWCLLPGNDRYAYAFTENSVFGGNPTAVGQSAPSYFFLTNFWRVRVANGEVVSFAFNLYTEDYATPFIVESGSGVINQVSDAPIVEGGGTLTNVWTVPEKDEVLQYSKKASDNAEQANLKL